MYLWYHATTFYLSESFMILPAITCYLIMPFFALRPCAAASKHQRRSPPPDIYRKEEATPGELSKQASKRVSDISYARVYMSPIFSFV